MKKLKYLLFILLIIPCMVKADMGAPEIRPYEMVVTNPDGVDYYNNDKKVGHLNKGDKFKVTYEWNGNYSISINNESYDLKSLDGTVLVKDSVDPTSDKDEYIKEEKSIKKAIIYADDGVDILAGPADIYKKVGHLSKDTKLTYKYYTDSYIYVESNGKKGWIEVLEQKVLMEKTQDFIARVDYKLSCATIPKNTVVRTYYTFDNWSHNSLLEYKNCTDIISNYTEGLDLIKVYKQYAVAKREYKVYTEADDKGDLLTTIPKEAKFISIASYGSRGVDEVQTYVEYEGKRGWIKADYWDEYETEKELENPNILDDIKENKEEKEVVEDIAPAPKKEKKTTKKTTKKPEDYTLMYVIIGSSVALAALITIILVNKNKKKSKKPVEKTEISVIEKSEIEDTKVVETPIEQTKVEEKEVSEEVIEEKPVEEQTIADEIKEEEKID